MLRFKINVGCEGREWEAAIIRFNVDVKFSLKRNCSERCGLMATQTIVYIHFSWVYGLCVWITENLKISSNKVAVNICASIYLTKICWTLYICTHGPKAMWCFNFIVFEREMYTLCGWVDGRVHINTPSITSSSFNTNILKSTACSNSMNKLMASKPHLSQIKQSLTQNALRLNAIFDWKHTSLYVNRSVVVHFNQSKYCF